jgi:adenylate/nucleoside-diphosphate kinase
VHKNNRQQERYFMRGFKAPEVDADGVEIPDAEIIDDPADFDRK